MNTLELDLKFGRRLMASRFLRWLPKHRLSIPSRCSLEIWCLLIDNLTANDVSPFPLFFLCVWDLWCLVVIWSFSHFGLCVIFQMTLNPWVGCEKYAECEWALELNNR